MRVLLLGDAAMTLAHTLHSAGDAYGHESDPIVSAPGFDWLVSYGYRHKVKADTLASFGRRAINLHTSFLPWNKGAHPNFWSFVENTPKGVTLHVMDEGIDTGPIIARWRAAISPSLTFTQSYSILDRMAVSMFDALWPVIRSGEFETEEQEAGGSRHFVKDLPDDCLPNGWNTTAADAITQVHRISALQRSSC